MIFNQYPNALFDEIAITSIFPESFLPFLDEISSFANEKQKEQIFASLLIFSSNQKSDISSSFTKTVLNYMTKNDENIINATLKLIEDSFHIKFAISLISNIKMKAEHSNQYTCSLIKVINNKNSMKIIDLLSKMLDRFGSVLEEDQFPIIQLILIMTIAMMMIKVMNSKIAMANGMNFYL